MVKRRSASSLWLFLFLLSSPILYCTVWYCCNHSLYPSHSPLLQRGAHFVQVSLLPYLNNEGIGSAPGQGNFDGSGYTYPTDQLPDGSDKLEWSTIPVS